MPIDMLRCPLAAGACAERFTLLRLRLLLLPLFTLLRLMIFLLPCR